MTSWGAVESPEGRWREAEPHVVDVDNHVRPSTIPKAAHSGVRPRSRGQRWAIDAGAPNGSSVDQS